MPARAPRQLAIVLFCGWLAACPHDDLPSLGAIPDFELTERSGQVVRVQDLDGAIWIINFIFTRCPDVCPTLSRQMARLQRELPQHGGATVRLLSIAVDPAHDTPSALRSYADELQAGPQWWFVTGTRESLSRLLRDGFHVAWGDDGPSTAPITHTDRFVLLDAHRQIRGYYHGSTAAEIDQLALAAVRLAAALAP